MHPARLKAATNNTNFTGYIGMTEQEDGAASRVTNRDHRNKILDGQAPDYTVLAQGLTIDEMAGIEALLIQRGREVYGKQNLSNKNSGHHIDEPAHPVIQAGVDVVSTNYRQQLSQAEVD